MQTAQMNSPRFSYQTAVPLAAATPHTLDDFRAVRGSYAGSFSGKSRHPIWIAVGMIAVVGSIAVGVNMYSDSHSAKIDSVAPAPDKRVLMEPTAPVTLPAPVEAPVAKEIAPAEALRAPASSVATKPAPVITKKVAPTPVAPASAVIATPPEVVPPVPAIVEPAPIPAPIVIEPPPVPAPTPAPTPEVPPVEPPKL